jgi:multicomponent K+:H+ antiporter subunit G
MSGVPPVVDAIVAVFALVGAVAALLGSVGLVTLRSFFQRVHAPTTASTLGTWSLALATMLQASFMEGRVTLHALLVPVLVSLTAPVTTIFLMRAAVFRRRVRGRAPEEERGERRPPDLAR